MNDDQLGRRRAIIELTNQLNNIMGQLQRLYNDCPHDMDKVEDIAQCAICDKQFGWFCEDSPDNLCHYVSIPIPTQPERRMVELEHKPPFKLPASHDPSKESSASCIFCGLPDERK